MPKSTNNPAPAIRNGSLRFKSASERDTAFRMLKAARVRFPGVLQKAVDNRTGVYLILFPGASQLVTAAHWENAMETAGVHANPSRHILYEVGDFYVVRATFGRSEGFEVWKNEATASTRVARIGYAGQVGLDKAKAEADRRAGLAKNPQFTRPSLIGSVVDTYFPVDLMEGSVKGAVEDLKDLVGRSGGGSRGQKRK